MIKKYPITGTFIDEITYDIPASNWTNEQWAADLDHMKAVGIDTVIIMRGVFYDKCIYPSKIFPTLKEEGEDFAGFIMEEAAKRDMQVFLGMYIKDLTWNCGDYLYELKQNKIYMDLLCGILPFLLRLFHHRFHQLILLKYLPLLINLMFHHIHL